MATEDNNPAPLPVTGGSPAASAAPAAPAPVPAPTPASTPPAQKPSPQSLQERRLFNVYRPDDGHRPRAVIGIAVAVLALWGCHQLHEWLYTGKDTFWGKTLFELGDEQFAVYPAVALALILAVASLFGVFKLINYPRFVDFLIDTESELKKVSWASRRQVIDESIVVLATVVIVGVFVFVVDQALILVRSGIKWDDLWNKLR
jgi:preprotein translocase SecE subunit